MFGAIGLLILDVRVLLDLFVRLFVAIGLLILDVRVLLDWFVRLFVVCTMRVFVWLVHERSFACLFQQHQWNATLVAL